EKDGGGAHPAARQYGITAIPAMYLVDRDGKIVSVSARGSQLVSLLAKMMGPPQQLAEKAALAGDWQRASQVLTLAAGLSPNDVQVWTALAVAQLLAGDRAGYESTCQTAAARFARSGSSWTKASLVRLCSLASNSTVKDEAVIAAANTLSADVDSATVNLNRGLFEFRLGRFEQAIERLPKAGDDLQVPLSLLYRAMACRHLEREDEAKQLYRQGCEEIGKRVPTAKGDKLADYMPARWIVWGLLEIARREAEAVLSGAASGSPEKLLHLLASGNAQGALDALTKMIEQEPNNPGLVKQRADLCVRLGEWQKAARDLDQMVQANPTDSLAWLRVSPVLALAGDKPAYRRFCEAMVQRFGTSTQPPEFEKAIKAALLVPGAFNVSELPLAKLEQSLDGSGPSAWPSGWGWATRALAEYRRGNADNALKFANRVESSSDYATAVNLHPLGFLLKALALADLKRDQEARDAYAEGGKLLEARAAELKRTGSWHHDILIAQIIATEVKARLEKAN
nr:tetratricopeptide repeat protein [Pirellulaceae bacterium]